MDTPINSKTSKVAIVVGSSRRDGNTSKIVDYLNVENTFTVYNLLDYNISYYDYKNENIGDDFIGLMDEITTHYNHLVIATPVYWYSMSAIVKCFLDRFTDLISVRKDIGYKLKTMQLSLISCSNADDLNVHFAEVFKATSGYLNMEFGKHLHTWIAEEHIPPTVKKNIDLFKLIF